MEKVSTICIVGGGPAGVAAIKFLLAENCFKTIDVFEQRDTVGGVWNYTPENDDSPLRVPSTDPHVPLEKPVWRDLSARSRCDIDNARRPTFQSPLYERLEANLPKMLMQHSDQSFDDESQLFPTHDTITLYLQRYAKDVRHLITFETQVTGVKPNGQGKDHTWLVSTCNLRTGLSNIDVYDAVLITSGHYCIPYIPNINGIRHWHDANPGIISHSKYFRRPEEYRGKKVVVVGWGPSGSDIGTQIGKFASELLVSVRTNTPLANVPADSVQLPEIEEFVSHESREAHFIRCKGGIQVANIDCILFCTGYLYSYPFLAEDISPPLVTKGDRVENVYQHVFYTKTPTLAFLTLPWNIIPFPVAEVQAATVARVWSGRLKMPSLKSMEEWERQGIAERGSGKSFHRLATPRDVDYINELWSWCGTARDEFDTDQSHKTGKESPFWGPRERWMRLNVPAFKAAFAKKGEDRRNIKTLEDLGFHFPEDGFRVVM